MVRQLEFSRVPGLRRRFLSICTNLLVDMLDPNGHVLQEIAFLLIDELRDQFQRVLIPPILSLIITGVFFFFFFGFKVLHGNAGAARHCTRRTRGRYHQHPGILTSDQQRAALLRSIYSE